MGNYVPVLNVELRSPNTQTLGKGRGDVRLHNPKLSLCFLLLTPNSGQSSIETNFTPLNHLQSHGIVSSWNARKSESFDAFYGFGWNTYCLLIRVDRSRNLVGVKRAIALAKLDPAHQVFQQTFESPGTSPECSRAQ